MLWSKAWLETRVRFLICLIGITALCGYNVFRMDTGLTSPVNLGYYYSVLHSSHSQLVMMWILAVNFVTMGGLLREKAVGAASFSLALPFSRLHLMCVRISVSLVQSIALIVIPWTAMFLMGSVVGKTHSISQALFHVVLLVGGGTVLYAIALLTSSLVEGEYTAPMVSFGILVLVVSQLDSPSLRAFSPLHLMAGSKYYNTHSGLLVGPVPWVPIAAFALVAALLVALSVKAIQMREF